MASNVAASARCCTSSSHASARARQLHRADQRRSIDRHGVSRRRRPRSLKRMNALNATGIRPAGGSTVRVQVPLTHSLVHPPTTSSASPGTDRHRRSGTGWNAITPTAPAWNTNLEYGAPPFQAERPRRRRKPSERGQIATEPRQNPPVPGGTPGERSGAKSTTKKAGTPGRPRSSGDARVGMRGVRRSSHGLGGPTAAAGRWPRLQLGATNWDAVVRSCAGSAICHPPGRSGNAESSVHRRRDEPVVPERLREHDAGRSVGHARGGLPLHGRHDRPGDPVDPAAEVAGPRQTVLHVLRPGATHAPHHVPTEWADRYRGRFDAGWDALREETFAKQQAMGVVPADAVLAERSAGIPAWDEMCETIKPVLACEMEVYAGFLSYADHHIGRLIDAIERLGILDDTLIYVIVGDNGASAEGNFVGTTNEGFTINHERPRDRGVHGRAHGRARDAPVVQPLRHRLGARDGHLVPVDQAGRLALGRHAQRHRRPLARRDHRER